MYSITINNPNKDFNRYIDHSKFYTNQDLEIVMNCIKAELQERLTFLGDFQEKIMLNVFKSDTHDISIVFDPAEKDVNIFCQLQIGRIYTIVTLMAGEKNSNFISATKIDNDFFVSEINNPIKLLIISEYENIKNTIDNGCKQLMATQNFVKSIVTKVNEDLEKGKKIAEEAKKKD